MLATGFSLLSEPYCKYVSVCLSLVLLQGIGDTTSHEMVIHLFDVPTKSDHCTLFMKVQVKGIRAKVGYGGGNLLGKAESGDCLGCYWEGNSVW